MPALPHAYLVKSILPDMPSNGAERRGKNWFGTIELMAVKKWTRNRVDLIESKGVDRETAVTMAINDVHKMLPGFRQAWEERNKYRFNDEFFRGRVNHQSDKMDTKVGHLSLQDLLDSLQFEEKIYNWEEWTTMIKANKGDVKLLRDKWVYVLPFRKPDATEYEVQKVGFCSDPKRRYGHYVMSAEANGAKISGIPRHTYGLLPADYFAFTYHLGVVEEYYARMVEARCHVAVGSGKRPAHGHEWFYGNIEEVIERMKMEIADMKERGWIT